MWEGENYMKILYRKQLVGTGFHPLLLLAPIALRTMPISAGMVLIMKVSAFGIVAPIQVIAHCRSTTLTKFMERLS